MNTTLPSSLTAELLAAATTAPPPPSPGRAPTHVVYGGAHLFRADGARKLGDVALRALDAYAPDDVALAAALGLASPREGLRARVHEKLTTEPVEDLRIDFEDGYGPRLDVDEDMHALQVGRALVDGLRRGTLPPWVGIRVRTFGRDTRARAMRTLDLVLTAVADAECATPEGFVVTLPKVSSPREVVALARCLDALERALSWPVGRVKVELMLETPAALVGPRGELSLGDLVDAADARCVAVHLGAYDLTASVGVAAPFQSLAHPLCDVARAIALLVCAPRGVRVADGATAVLPVAPHRGDAPTEAQRHENSIAVHRAWRAQSDDIRRAMRQGVYQGWDLHPVQLVSRHATTQAVLREHLDETAARLKGFVEQAARATRQGAAFDDAATGQGLLHHVVRAIDCGAITESEAVARTGVSAETLRTRSFAALVRAVAPTEIAQDPQ